MNKYNIDEVLLDLNNKKDLIDKAKQKYLNIDYAYNKNNFHLISRDILNNNDTKIKYIKKSGYVQAFYKSYDYKEAIYIIPYFYDKDLECNIYACLPYLYKDFSEHLLTDQLDFKLFEYISYALNKGKEINIYDTILPEKILSKKVINKILKELKEIKKFNNISFSYIENGNKYFTSKIRDKLQNCIFE